MSDSWSNTAQFDFNQESSEEDILSRQEVFGLTFFFKRLLQGRELRNAQEHADFCQGFMKTFNRLFDNQIDEVMKTNKRKTVKDSILNEDEINQLAATLKKIIEKRQPQWRKSQWRTTHQLSQAISALFFSTFWNEEIQRSKKEARRFYQKKKGEKPDEEKKYTGSDRPSQSKPQKFETNSLTETKLAYQHQKIEPPPQNEQIRQPQQPQQIQPSTQIQLPQQQIEHQQQSEDSQLTVAMSITSSISSGALNPNEFSRSEPEEERSERSQH